MAHLFVCAEARVTLFIQLFYIFIHFTKPKTFTGQKTSINPQCENGHRVQNTKNIPTTDVEEM